MAMTDAQVAWISGVLAGAFAPLRCAAEGVDHLSKLDVRIYDGDDEVLHQRLTEDDATDRGSLEAAIAGIRDTLARRGRKLADWDFPELARGAEE